MSSGRNLLYYGDNLDVLREHVEKESVDLVYLDPPFKSNQDYNVLFAEHGTRSAAQIRAFEDTWTYDEPAARALWETIDRNPGPIANALIAFEKLLPQSDMLAYLAMMAPRLIELRRVLKPAGAIYLHCDPTASHYLKLLMDSVFGPANFRNDIVWKRKAGRGETNSAAIRFGVTNDNILFYARSKATPLTRQYRESNPDYIASKFTHTEPDGRRYRLDNLTSPSPRPNLYYEYKGHLPPSNGWAVGRERMEQMDREGRLYIPDNPDRRIQRKRYLDELEGETVDSLWDDIPPINSQAKERLGYPTQKPEALLERIIRASSTEGEVVLDPFCGCGTAISVAQRLKRRWIGIDITHIAVGLIKHRLADSYGLQPRVDYDVIGEPTDLEGARQLASEDPWQFQAWALGLVGARTDTSAKKGADKGVDGRAYFRDAEGSKEIILSVKSGKTGAAHVDQLRGVVEKEGAAIGALITLQEPTKPMRENAASAGMYAAPGWNKPYPRIQLLTVSDLLGGAARLEYPPAPETFKKAPKADGPELEQLGLEPEP